jgi:tetratricopeptide (TPR) repeat protein
MLAGCAGQPKQFDTAQAGQAPKAQACPPVVTETTVSTSELMAQLQQTRADYKRLLQVMRRWYIDHGLHDKATWAKRELSDLNKIRTTLYVGSKGIEKRLGQFDESESASMQAIDMSQISEPDIIEQLMQIRTSYRSILEELNRSYCACGQTKQAESAAKELKDLDFVRLYPYLVVVDIQDTDLAPRDSIVEADRMYARGRKLHESAKFLPFMNNKHQLKEAMDLYVQLIKCYPTSDKIDDAAFWAGEISKEYFNDDVQAVKYYEMAIKWDPRTPHPARFQAAVVYDFRMHDRARAMELYQDVLRYEADIDVTNTRFSATRLNELLKETVIVEEVEVEGEVSPPEMP